MTQKRAKREPLTRSGRTVPAARRQMSHTSGGLRETVAPVQQLKEIQRSLPAEPTSLAKDRAVIVPKAEESLQKKTADEEEQSIQAKSSGPVQREKNLTGMPDQLKEGVEALSGRDLSGVRVHRNSDKPADVNAHAYAQGKDIHLAPGQDRHLPHEAWHTVQQMEGRVKPTGQVDGVSINDDPGLEREADIMGGRAVQTQARGSE